MAFKFDVVTGCYSLKVMSIKLLLLAFLLLLFYTDNAAGSKGGAMSCTDTKSLFKHVKTKLGTKIPIDLSPIYYIMIILPILFIIKTIYDLRVHAKEQRYIQEWEKKHLGENGIKNEIFVDFPTQKERPAEEINFGEIDDDAVLKAETDV